jgi:phage shock protein A
LEFALMFRQVITLFRGAAHNAAEDFTDRHALLLLEQQLRDSAHAVAAARKAVALAIAQNAQEVEQHEALAARASDLEARAVAAIRQGKPALAREAAEAIAQLEAELEISRKAQAVFADEIARLRANVRAAETRLRDVERGRRLATATDAAHKIRASMPDDNLECLAEAEATLLRLRRRQKEFDLTEQALRDLDPAGNPARVSEKLAAAGCGEPLRPSADDVLARLQARAGEADGAASGNGDASPAPPAA